MGRYETLNAASKDVVDCLLPGIAINFGLTNVLDVIPQEIRMRTWDCDRKEHIIAKSEDDPRNWGLQFLKDLVTISRIKKGKLDEFQADLREKVRSHEKIHPWARLADIKEIKEHYQAPELPAVVADPQGDAALFTDGSSSYSSSDSYFEELVETERSGSKKRSRHPHGGRRSKQELYETRRQKSRKHHSDRPKRLRRSSSAAWERPVKSRRHDHDRRSGYSALQSQGLSFTGSSNVTNGHENLEDMPVEELELSLQIAESELNIARLKLQVLTARRQSKNGREVKNDDKSKKGDKPKKDDKPKKTYGVDQYRKPKEDYQLKDNRKVEQQWKAKEDYEFKENYKAEQYRKTDIDRHHEGLGLQTEPHHFQ